MEVEIYRIAFYGSLIVSGLIIIGAVYIISILIKMIRDERRIGREDAIKTVGAIERMTEVLRENLNGHRSMTKEMELAKERYNAANANIVKNGELLERLIAELFKN